MNKIKIYLDDIRTPVDNSWVVVRNYDEFVNLVKKVGLENIQEISLDHDLGLSAMDEYFRNAHPNNFIDYNNITEKTGYDCAKFLVKESMDNSIKLPLINVHSANPVGSENIMTYINNYLIKHCGLLATCTRSSIKII